MTYKHITRTLLIGLAVIEFSFITVSFAQQASSIIVYTAAEIVTLDSGQPMVKAVAVDGDRIVAIGSLDEIRQTFTDQILTVDTRFKDQVLIPGLINQHEHAWLTTLLFIAEILSIEDWVLPDKTIERSTNAADYRERLAQIVAEHSDPSEVLYTWGFHQYFHGELTRADLDEISDTIPIVVLQRSIHEQIHNSRALEYFGIDQALIDRAPESIRAQTNLEEGHFWEQGQGLIVGTVFADIFRPDRYLPALQEAENYWHAAGSTLVAEPGGSSSPARLEMQNQVLGDAQTPFRMYYIADGRSAVANFAEDQVITETEKLYSAAKGTTEYLPQQVKLFADGAMFSQLMQMSEGYLDGHHGEWMMDPEVFAKAFRIYWDAGFQIHVHQNGDAGLDMVLDNLDANMQRNFREDHRTVIVHFGFSRPDQVDRMARLGAQVSGNPFYPIILADQYSKVGIGAERAQEMVRLGDVVRAGVPLSLHSDTPMASGQPLRLMSNAVNRITVGGNLAGPTQRISAEAALRAVTLGAAHSLRLEEEVGSISPGKLANITVLAENPLKVSPEKIGDIKIWGTVHEGRVFPLQ
jgi:predicted amidohydrolase YtcJ